MLAANALALLALAGSVSANGISLSLGTRINLGASASIKASASASIKSSCTGKGDFITELLGAALCCSSETRTTPDANLTCPFDWGMHKTAKCCIPQQESSACDCGEGYTFNEQTKKCVKNSGSCSSSQWWHERSSSCCDNSWKTSPPNSTCPSGVSCPTDWFWHKTESKCKPLHPRAPEPDCSDWNSNTQCCGGSSPSQAASNGKRQNKRAFKAREQTALFPQTALDRTYCPNGLHACTVNGNTGGEWSYECIDPIVELEACGGCLENGGQDCTNIAHALSVGCSVGTCEVFSCKYGFKPSANATECIAV
ncbi:hypothetical protein, variant [Cryptococcus amylolentus CBS 6039]|uniref:Protein CPL1-like domain-containing protein n=2 Tax=Cryptococcus amylolentus TaxID=104669 RepID=A0A1E3I2J4_9TREE|nr:hypothetical protein, variant [Cryptococcus amylolentus CBS 6039]ODN82812.1 hypothetical protein, variant [Cryptococcus amylolentus CBS 6039]ODO10477.1 hypothetical protein I350_01072 [Cryptococcus amylolentus CBS 6273]